MKLTKRRLILLCCMAVCLCALLISIKLWQPRYPEQAADGAAWDSSWTMIGGALGAEPLDGFALLDSSAVYTATDTYLAAWASGEPVPYTNAEGGDSELYEAELFVLLVGRGDVKGKAKEAHSTS